MRKNLPDDYTPVYLIDRRSPGPMAVILFVAAFFYRYSAGRFPHRFRRRGIHSGGTRSDRHPQAVGLPGRGSAWDAADVEPPRAGPFDLLRRGFQGETLKIPFSPHAPVASIKEFYWTKKTFYVYLLLPPVLFTAGFFIGMACTGSGPFFLDVPAVPASQPAGLLSSGERRHGSFITCRTTC